jgi:hypothetical protein
MIICCLLFALNAAGQETIDSVSTQEKTDSTTSLVKRLYQVQQFLDTKAKKKVDPNYIEVPDKPWRVIMRYKENAVDVDFSNTLESLDPGDHSYLDWRLCFEPPVAASIGFWVGYRGTGISFSKSLAKNAGRYFSISTTGAKYGFNFRLRRFSTSAVKLETDTYIEGEGVTEYDEEDNMLSPVWIRSAYLNGYYVFNGRRYSQAAAYNQAVIQRRSAGSFLLGATWYQSSFDYSDVENSIFMELARSVGRIKVHQANIGIGYGYNFVPFRGFVINAMAMPTFSVYNRVKIYKYDFNYTLFLDENETDNYGEWNSETKTWANGKTHKALEIVNNTVVYPDDAESWEVDSETEYSWLHVNLDLRLGIAYNWRNYFIGLQGQYNNFHYKKDISKVNIFDAYARLSLGVRL